MIQDMYEEEYFVSVLKPLSGDASFGNALFYKYYSELSSEQIASYDTQTIDQRFT